jgi:hypothetical protein
MKPLCLVIGTEKHICLGLTPMGVPAPNPNEICISLGPIDMPLGDSPSPTVSAHTARLIKRGHDSKFLRPHFSTGLPPLPSAVPPPLDLGLIAVVIAFGQAKTVWGPYSITADFGGGASPAVIFLAPGMFLGAANFSMCSEPMPKMNIKGVQILPNVFNVQVPSTVFAGMTIADIIGNIVAAIVDAVLSKLLEVIFKNVPGLKQVKKLVEKVVEKVLGVALKPLTRVLAAKVSGKAIQKVEERLQQQVGMEASGRIEKKVEEMVDHQIEKGVEGLAAKTVDKEIENLATPLTEKGVDVAADSAKEGAEKVFGEEGAESEGGEGEGKGGQDTDGEAGEGTTGPQSHGSAGEPKNWTPSRPE